MARKRIHPVKWWGCISTVSGWWVGWHTVAGLGWAAIAAVLLFGWFFNSWHRSEADCMFCHGSPKRRGGGSGESFHRCLWPRRLGGCGGTGKRNRVLYNVTGRGLGR